MASKRVALILGVAGSALLALTCGAAIGDSAFEHSRLVEICQVLASTSCSPGLHEMLQSEVLSSLVVELFPDEVIAI